MAEPTTTLQTKTENANKMIVVSPGRPPYPVKARDSFGISPGDWVALVDAVFPSAKTTEGVLLALSYCRARNLDPFKRPVHIVPIWDSKRGEEVESVWPGIGELRTTAARTGASAGNDEAVFGPDETATFAGVVGKGQYAKSVEKTVTFPAWCSIVQYRMVQGQRVPFPGPRVLWRETYATMGASDVPNEMWATRPYGQLEKCAEAASLRRAFPEELGSDLIVDEVQRRKIIEVSPSGSRTVGIPTAKREPLKAADLAEEVEVDFEDPELELDDETQGEGLTSRSPIALTEEHWKPIKSAWHTRGVISDAQIKRLIAIAAPNYTVEDLKRELYAGAGVDLDDIPSGKPYDLIAALFSLPKPAGGAA